MLKIDKHILNNELREALSLCDSNNLNNLGLLLTNIIEKENPVEAKILKDKFKNNISNSKTIKILLSCNWTSSKNLIESWKRFAKADGLWGKLELVENEPADYLCIINSPNGSHYKTSIPLEKTILFRMEPNMEMNDYIWGIWANPEIKDKLLFYGSHENHYNNIEWHLSKTYTELMEKDIVKNEEISNILSAVVSSKYTDPGHIKRIDFLKFLESKGLKTDIYGSNHFNWNNYKDVVLPHSQKDDGMFPYKYHFNCENHSIKNYFTEKLTDGILAECLTFYCGCPNISSHIDPRAYVYLELDNFEDDYNTIKKSIESNLWEQRIDIIRKEKKRILDELQFFPRLSKIIQ